jgi:hypothetical protein
MASANVLALISKAEAALKGKPPIGGSICCNFGADGVAYLYPDNRIAAFDCPADADCTISLSLAELSALEGGASITWAVLTGAVKIEGDEGLAKKFGAIVAEEKG